MEEKAAAKEVKGNEERKKRYLRASDDGREIDLIFLMTENFLVFYDYNGEKRINTDGLRVGLINEISFVDVLTGEEVKPDGTFEFSILAGEQLYEVFNSNDLTNETELFQFMESTEQKEKKYIYIN